MKFTTAALCIFVIISAAFAEDEKKTEKRGLLGLGYGGYGSHAVGLNGYGLGLGYGGYGHGYGGHGLNGYAGYGLGGYSHGYHSAAYIAEPAYAAYPAGYLGYGGLGGHGFGYSAGLSGHHLPLASYHAAPLNGYYGYSGHKLLH